jgi:hypothetical protein
VQDAVDLSKCVPRAGYSDNLPQCLLVSVELHPTLSKRATHSEKFRVFPSKGCEVLRREKFMHGYNEPSRNIMFVALFKIVYIQGVLINYMAHGQSVLFLWNSEDSALYRSIQNHFVAAILNHLNRIHIFRPHFSNARFNNIFPTVARYLN